MGEVAFSQDKKVSVELFYLFGGFLHAQQQPPTIAIVDHYGRRICDQGPENLSQTCGRTSMIIVR